MKNKELTILFDLDGTLIDSTEAILESFYFAFKDQTFDFDGDDEDIKKHIGYPLEIMFENLGVEKSDTVKFIESYKKHYRIISEKKTVLLNEAKEAVLLASSFARLGIVTTKTTKYTIPLLENLGIYGYFETIIGRQEVVNPKPHPEPILKALENMKLEPSNNIFMIGDTKLDLIAANEANIIGVGVLCGYGKEEDLKQYSKLIAKSAIDAVTIIQNNFN
ncbi:MAG: HAD family hydrolase [Campylobacterota bacterium]|nr:HAD family hydrolase [Campylobacterota bacterium]